MTNQLPNHHHHHHHHHHQQQQQRRAVDLRIPAIEKYAYCLCLHVKPTTIFIAVFKLIRALLFASILLNTEFSMNEQSLGDIGMGPMDDRHRSTAAALTILTRIIMASVSAVAIYAVISGRAALLMPLYAMLLVDFFFTLPAFYNRDLDSSFAEGLSDFRGYPNPNTQYSRYSQMLFSTIGMIVKIYFLCVIWKCYRYLRLIELVSPIRLSEIYPHIHPTNPQFPIVRVLGGSDAGDIGSAHNVAPPPYESIASSTKPPNYEEAMKTSSTVMAINQQLPMDPNLHRQEIVIQAYDPNCEQQQTAANQFVVTPNVVGSNSAAVVVAESSLAPNVNLTPTPGAVASQPVDGQNNTDSSSSRVNASADNSQITTTEQQTVINMVTQQQQQQQQQQSSESQVTNVNKSTSNTISIQQRVENNNQKSDKHDV